jgi:putative aldouronate transport system substrate-binding protein
MICEIIDVCNNPLYAKIFIRRISMKKGMKKLIALLLGTAVAVTALGGCTSKTTSTTESTSGNTNSSSQESTASSTTGEETELKIMLRGDKPDGWDAVETAVEDKLATDGLNIKLNITWVSNADYKDKLNLAITSGEEWDLVFDAPWSMLKKLAADNYYADLSSYWNNDAYPGLKKCFSETLIQNNKFFDQECAVPILQAYGTGLQTVHYRQDWADEWGIGTIDSYDKLIEYWDACLANEGGSVYPLGVVGSRGFYQLLSNYGINEANIQGFQEAGIFYYAYIKDNKVAAIAASGEGDEAFKDFPAPFNTDFDVKRYDTYAEWRNKGYIETDSINQSDEKTMFYSGLCGSIIGTLDDYETVVKNLETYSPGAKLGEFFYNEKVATMEEGAIATSFAANNFLCIPKSSEKIDQSMQFLNWIFEDETNHDLITYGIEGKDWQDNGDGTYKMLSTYSFPSYELTSTKEYVKYSDAMPSDLIEYKKYELKDSTYTYNTVTGFTFDSSGIQTEYAQTKAITDKVYTVKGHGILNDGTTTYSSAAEMLKANLEEAYKSGAQTLQDTIVDQLNAYMAANGAHEK